MALITENIQQLVSAIIDGSDVFLVDVVLRGERSSKVIEVYVDTDKGITLDECSRISRELSAKLDETDIMTGRYRLDVSSPGLDRPLKVRRQYEKNIGRMCRVISEENGEIFTREGILESVSGECIQLHKKGIRTEIAITAIKETFIIPQIK
ncbi:MAG: ribosome maturation factor RimP [Bacteroidota bacterium]